MAFLSIWLDVGKDEVNAIERVLQSYECIATCITPHFDSDLATEVNPPWQRAEVEAHLTLGTDVAGLNHDLARLGVRIKNLSFVGDKDWVESWRQTLTPLDFGTFVIVPRDHRNDQLAKPVIKLDPGLAFGTGSHESTALCLRWLSRQRLHDLRVLDAGCGSGILSIVAAKLGASEVVAVDIEEQALQATRENALLNAVNIPVQKNFATDQPFDIVLANILSETLIELATTFQRVLIPGGTIVLAGILESQMLDVQRAYPFIEFEPVEREGPWVLLTGSVRP